MNTLQFVITSLLIILVPGTGVTYTISQGLTKGKRASLYAAIGCTLGITPHLCISSGLSYFLMQMDEKLFLILKIAGAIYLIYLGVTMILSHSVSFVSDQTTTVNGKAIIKRGILINLLNPKLTLFFFTFLPQYISGRSNFYLVESLLYGLAFMLLTLIIFMGYGILAGTAARFLTNSPKKLDVIQRIFGLSFVAFAVQLALSSM